MLRSGWLDTEDLASTDHVIGLPRPQPRLRAADMLKPPISDGRERSIVWAIIRAKVRVTGGLSRLKDFGHCFPG
jgi:hypothetical protein